MFQFPGFPPIELWIHSMVTGLQPAGFPHSDIKGSMPACGSPLLFAACHVLLRRLVPWHPPCALVRLITSFLRLSYIYFRLLSNLFLCNWSFKTSFLVFLFVQLSRCTGDLSPFRVLFRILKTIQRIVRQLFPGHAGLSASCPSFILSDVSFTLCFLSAIDLRFEASGFPSACSLERR